MKYLNFLLKFEKNKDSLKRDEILEIINDYKYCLNNYEKNKKFYSKCISVILRILICEKRILDFNPKIKFPQICGREIKILVDNQNIHTFNPNSINFDLTKQLDFQSFITQKLIWYDLSNIPTNITNDEYVTIASLTKKVIDKYYIKNSQDYCLNNTLTEKDKNDLVIILEKIGFNNITIYNFIKLMADKKSAHLDGWSPYAYLFSDYESKNSLFYPFASIFWLYINDAMNKK